MQPNALKNSNKTIVHMRKYQKYFSGIILGFLLNGTLVAAEKISAEAHTGKALAGTGLSDPNMAGNLIQTTLGLLLVLVIIGVAAWAFKRFGNLQVGAQGRMKIIGGVSLGTRERAVLLQVGDQQLVIGVAPGRVQLLHALNSPVPVEEKSADTMNFSSRLQAAILNRKNSSVDQEEK